MSNPYKPLEQALGYRFRNKAHLEAALTHRSFRYERDDVQTDNQRLEFLGDAALGLVAAGYLFRTHQEMQEGDLTRLRSKISSRQGLVTLARRIHLSDFLRLGRGERESGGDRRPSNLADALEAVLGAAYLDGRLKAVEKIFIRIFVPLLEESGPHRAWTDNPKGALQEICQQQWKISPRYRVVSEEGPAHSRVFQVEALLDGETLGQGRGSNKRAAEMQAATEALARLARRTGEQAPP